MQESAARQALTALREGEMQMGEGWQRAHQIVQGHEGERDCDLVHALCHWIEGDLGNRDYWYRRAGRRPAATIGAEWEALWATLT